MKMFNIILTCLFIALTGSAYAQNVTVDMGSAENQMKPEEVAKYRQMLGTFFDESEQGGETANQLLMLASQSSGKQLSGIQIQNVEVTGVESQVGGGYKFALTLHYKGFISTGNSSQQAVIDKPLQLAFNGEPAQIPLLLADSGCWGFCSPTSCDSAAQCSVDGFLAGLTVGCLTLCEFLV